MNKKVFAILSVIFTIIFTYKLKTGEFLFLNDQFFPFSFSEVADRAFFLFGADNLGHINSWQSVVQFWDAIYFFIVYAVGVNFIWAEKINILVALFISFSLSYAGLLRLGKLYSLDLDRYKVFLISFFYCFNPYTLALWTGGVYNIGSAITYSLAPIIIYYFHLSIFTESSIRTKLFCAVTLFFASFTFWLFAVIVYVLILYAFLYMLLNRERRLGLYIKNAVILGSLYIPLISIVIFNIIYKYINIEGSRDPFAQPGYGNQQGGLFYQLKFFFSWGIYTVWSPRTLYFFGDHFFSKKYNLGLIIFYFFVSVGVIVSFFPRLLSVFERISILKKIIEVGKKIDIKPVTIFVIIFALSLFFAKANQPPLGGVFVFLYKNMPFFSVFRNADIRFGFAIILSLSVLSLFAGRHVKRFPLAIIISATILLLSWNLVNGSAVMGLDVEKKNVQYIDRIIAIPEDYRNISDRLNNEKFDSSYVLSVPSLHAGYFDLGSSGIYIGQDIMPKLIKRNFIYTSSDSTKISVQANQKLKTIIGSQDIAGIKEFPIKYILYRNDVKCPECDSFPIEMMNSEYKLIEANKSLSLYEVPGSTPIVGSDGTTFRKISATKYSVNFNNISKPQDLRLLQAYSSKWKIYLTRKPKIETMPTCQNLINYVNSVECIGRTSFFDPRDILFLFKRNIFDETHEYVYDYGNKWVVSPDYILENFDESYYSDNADGSLDFQVIIYHKDQSWYLLAFLTSAILLILYTVVIRMSPKEE